MSTLFNRCLYIELADENGKGQKFNARTTNNKDGFDMSFSVVKTSEKEPNESSCTLYNLNEETRRAIEDKYIYCVIYGGYEEEYKLIGMGNISKVKHSYDSATVSTEITFEDGSNQYRDSRINKTYPSGTTYYKILKDISNSMGLPDPKILDVDETAVITNSHTLFGSSAKYLKEYCYKNGVRYSIQNNKLIIKKDDTAITSNAFVISEETGLVGSIEKTITKIHKKYNKTRKPLKKPTPKSIAARNRSIAEATQKFETKQYDKEHKLQFKTLMIPEIIPGSYLQIQSKFFPKNYCIVKNITLAGNNTDGDFGCDIEAIII